MSNIKNTFELDRVHAEKAMPSVHTPSIIQADTLFTFTSQLDFLIPYIKNSCLYPRFCDEDISYLEIPDIKKIYIPMKCFCDINLHRISQHLDWYGYFGLAFSKEWGMRKGIQPIQYINPYSELRKDFSSLFPKTLQSDDSPSNELENLLKNYMLHELMYYKPYEGNMKNRRTQKVERKCFTDECEWRYIPNLSETGFSQIYHDPKLNVDVMNDISNSLEKLPQTAIHFEYSDLKYIIIEDVSDFVRLVEVIDSINEKKTVKDELISKIIIWKKSKGDF